MTGQRRFPSPWRAEKILRFIRPAVEVERLVVGVTYDVAAPAPPPISSVGVGVCRTCINPRSRHSAEAHEFSHGPASDEHRPPRCAGRV